MVRVTLALFFRNCSNKDPEKRDQHALTEKARNHPGKNDRSFSMG
jgi:hypothetical protein